MVTLTELVIVEELTDLRQLVEQREWMMKVVDETTFIMILPAKDQSRVQLYVECDDYPTTPPAWHFRNRKTGALDEPADTPRGGQFFHGNGVICAPWNRLAYQARSPLGPHGDWTIGDWKSNSHTGGTTTLAAMALRIYVELQGSYEGRGG
jgi:hypothetical protein